MRAEQTFLERKRARRKTLKRLGASAVGAAGIGTAAGLWGLGAKQALHDLNARYQELNRRRGHWMPSKPNYVAVEPRKLFGIFHHGNFDPNEHGNCAGWATRSADELFGAKYRKGDAWDLRKLNPVVESRVESRGKSFVKPSNPFTKEELLQRIQNGAIQPGTLLGVHFEESENNKPGLAYTHILLYQGEENGRHFFGHVLNGVHVLSLEDVSNKRGFHVVELLAPHGEQVTRQQ